MSRPKTVAAVLSFGLLALLLSDSPAGAGRHRGRRAPCPCPCPCPCPEMMAPSAGGPAAYSAAPARVPVPKFTVDVGREPNWQATANLDQEKDADYLVKRHDGFARKRNWEPPSAMYRGLDTPPPTPGPGTEPVKNWTLYACMMNSETWIGDFTNFDDAVAVAKTYNSQSPRIATTIVPFDPNYAVWGSYCSSYEGKGKEE